MKRDRIPFIFLRIALVFCVPFVAHAQPAPQHSIPQVQNAPVSALPLNPVNMESLGIITDEQGALDRSIWAGTPRVIVEHLLTILPVNQHSNVLGGLRFRLLASPIDPPQGKGRVPSLLALRMRKLAEMGEYTAVSDIMQRLPLDFHNEFVEEAAIDTSFRASDFKSGCERVGTISPDYTRMIWKYYRLFCSLAEHDSNKAELAMKVMNEQHFQIPTGFTTALQTLQAHGAMTPESLLPLLDVMGKYQFFSLPLTDPVLPPEVLQAVAEREELPIGLRPSALQSWWEERKNLSQQERAEALASLYSTLEGLGVEIPQKSWYALLLSSYNPSPVVIRPLLADATKYQRVGEALALSLIAFGSEAPDKGRSVMIQTAIEALQQSGFDNDATQLAEEMLKVKA
jgi:hypothetical protein